MSFFGFSNLLIFITSIPLAVFFLIKQDRSKLHTTWGIFAFCVSLWGLGGFLIDKADNPGVALRFWQITHIGIILIPFLFQRFVQIFLNQKITWGKITIYVALLALFFINLFDLFTGTHFFIGGVTFLFNTVYYDYPANILYPAFVFLFVLTTITTHTELYMAYRKSSGVKKKQIEYFFLATILGFSGGVFSFLPVFGIHLYPYPNVTVALYPIIMTIGILQYQLFDVRIIIRRTIVYTTLLTALFLTYGIIILLFAQLLPYGSFNQNTLIPNFIASLVIGFSFDPLRRWLQDRTDAFLYKKEYQQQSVLRDLSSNLNNVIGLDEALEIVMQTITKTIKVHHAVSYVFQPAENSGLAIKRIKQIGYQNTKNLLLQDRDFTVDYFANNPQILTTNALLDTLEDEEKEIEELSHRSKDKNKNLDNLGEVIREHARKQTVLRKLRTLDAEIAVPLHLDKQCIGLILLSGKLSDEPYGTNDIQLLELIGANAISSIQKAKLYEGDQMKSEFVSIASHELLTPISAIEGYLSMILDEHIGTVDEQARGYLTKVYLSSKRLSQLVKDLLSVSRIESGKMTINLQAVDMSKMITDTIDQLRFVAQNKGLTLEYTPPATALPMVKADPDRVMQVLVNLVSNGIKYTPKGNVTLKMSSKAGHIQVDVSDTGLGMSKDQRAHLFEKFYRVASSDTVGIMGTGLGLYITKSIMERMGGSISLDSTPGKGSTFTIILPIFRAETSAMSQ